VAYITSLIVAFFGLLLGILFFQIAAVLQTQTSEESIMVYRVLNQVRFIVPAIFFFLSGFVLYVEIGRTKRLDQEMGVIKDQIKRAISGNREKRSMRKEDELRPLMDEVHRLMDSKWTGFLGLKSSLCKLISTGNKKATKVQIVKARVPSWAALLILRPARRFTVFGKTTSGWASKITGASFSTGRSPRFMGKLDVRLRLTLKVVDVVWSSIDKLKDSVWLIRTVKSP
jgi:hypothetical protein